MNASRKTIMRRLPALLAAVVLLNVLLAACAIPPEELATEQHAMSGMATSAATPVSEPNHDHPMAALDGMPAEVQAADARTQDAYRFAAANRAAAESVPCYCGCVGLGHVTSYDCYVAGEAADGALSFDLHAANCTVCVDITHDQMRLMDAGLPTETIRGYIDGHYAKFGPPTPMLNDSPDVR